MTFTYDYETDPDIAKVRFIFGDTVESESEVSDEEITAVYAESGGSHSAAAIKILRSLAAKYSRRATLTSGNEKIELGKVSDSLLRMVADLEASLGQTGSALVSRTITRK